MLRNRLRVLKNVFNSEKVQTDVIKFTFAVLKGGWTKIQRPLMILITNANGVSYRRGDNDA
ncbi:hypothetical protein AS203_00515 [Hoylesella enoeca]|uniref:Uncharacterized protein n=1 Tax=Hoylesella enoeca TaxID=76123 RepID=A0A0S2KHI0_9BACT|nr:hypothetical protein AS203_00515 [Hoylesella enoeca]